MMHSLMTVFNITSGTDVATGKWRFAKTNVMNSTQYVVVVSSGYTIDSFSTGVNANAIEKHYKSYTIKIQR